MNNLSLYIHIPFCEQKCPYCDFYSLCDKNEFYNYVTNIVSKIEYYAKRYNREICTIYFGGGTPSVLGTQRICTILSAIYENFKVNEDAEITVEVNPCSSSELDFAMLKAAGVNRVSVGLQSAIENELKTLGRRHSAKDAQDTVQRIKESGINNISLDLMICVPSQTKDSLTESIKFCKDCNVTHISAYILKIEENTKFFKIKDSLELFDDDEQAELYIHTVEQLKKYGFEQYEISNFCKKGFEGKHNLRYWRDEEYLGIGPSAHSFVDGKRFYYDRNLKSFYDDITVSDGEGGDISEYIMLSLRLKEGLNLNNLQNKYGYKISRNFKERLNMLNSQGLIEIMDDNISLTTHGFLVSNSIINYLCDSL